MNTINKCNTSQSNSVGLCHYTQIRFAGWQGKLANQIAEANLSVSPPRPLQLGQSVVLPPQTGRSTSGAPSGPCLLYTSDAADE